MKSLTLSRFLGMVLALNLVACAHELPVDEQFAQQTADSMEVSDSDDNAWENDTVAQLESAQLDAVARELETDFVETAELDPSKTESSDEQVVAHIRPVPTLQVPTPKTPSTKTAAMRTPAAPREQTLKNRYYVVRTGDSPEYIAKLIYQDAAKAAKLVAWNGPAAKWSAGTVLYYVSPKHPQDSQMKSLYEELELPAESVTIQEGDSLASLAQQRLGSALSVKEIALVNGIKEDEPIRPGQILQMYPSPLIGASSTPKVVESRPAQVLALNTQPAPAAQVAPIEKPAETVVQKSDAVRGPVEITLAPAPPAQAKPKASLASSVMATLFSHPLVLGCTLLVLSLFAGFFYMQRRRSGSRYDL